MDEARERLVLLKNYLWMSGSVSDVSCNWLCNFHTHSINSQSIKTLLLSRSTDTTATKSSSESEKEQALKSTQS